MADNNFDTTFQSTSKKLILPKAPPEYEFYDNHDEFSTDELVRLLAFMEGELEAREDVIEHLKRERTKILLAEAKYGKLSVNDPFAALRRDSTVTNEIIDEEKIAQMYESQVEQLEKLIAAQKKTQKNAAFLLGALDKKHYKLIRKLEADRNAKIKYAKQGDDLVAVLEKERGNLQQQIEYHTEETRKVQIEKDQLEMKMVNEKKKHEAIVLYLIQERKQMLLKMHELKMNAEQLLSQQKPSTSSTNLNDRELIEELKKEVTFLRSERESLTKTQKIMKVENLSLKETVRGQEADLQLLRKNLSSGSKIVEKMTLPHLNQDIGSLIVANRGATSAGSTIKSNTTTSPSTANSLNPSTRLSSSSSFPIEKSRLPKAPPSPMMTNNNINAPRTSLGAVAAIPGNSRTMSSPVKKTPAMGVSSTTVRRPQTSGNMQITPELEQLEAAIQSMNVLSKTSPRTTSSFSTSTITKRSSSLPREQNNNPRRSLPAQTMTQQQQKTTNMNNSTNSMISTTRIAGPSNNLASERKLSGTVKRNNGILAKAFGGSGAK
ncbi:unnamed protein product [Caenorhabditis angaria]|uniref:Cortactin-binding protein-2 N-terminal domain-containing protein n=1 Tax=Caenorhabditis angaria TaxID=860376 RepID=A0A9P1N3D2_9PELO|nr:unnamed protein product [Caenorhabditis angaria]